MMRTHKKPKQVKFALLLVAFLAEICDPTDAKRWIELAKYIPNFQPPSWIKYQSPKNGMQYSSTTVGIIEANGYPVETHLVTTEDGFILELHRIPTFSTPNNRNPLPVLVMHGNFQSSADWVINSPANNSFAFILSDLGHDVWLGNHRGNTYSKTHVKFSTNSHHFWDFSFHEMGIYDTPAMVDYVLQQTGQLRLHYVSFSYSTAAFVAGLSMRPEYNGKIATGVLLGPSVFLANSFNGLLSYFYFTAKIVDGLLNTFGAIPIISHSVAGMLNNFLPIICNPRLDIFGICVSVTRIMFGNDGNLITKEQMPLITSVIPTAASLKVWNHIVQLTGTKNFVQYDYGRNENLARYDRETPPPYNLSAVTVPIALIVGGYDFIAHREDAKTLAEHLPNLIEPIYRVPYKEFTHLDFSYGREPAAEAYYHAIDLMRRQEDKDS